MAAISLLGTVTFNTTNNAQKTVTATPAVGDLIVIVVAHSGYSGTVAPTDNNSAGGGTYFLAGSDVKNSSGDKLTMWVRRQLVYSATSTIFEHSPGSASGGGLAVFKVTGMSRTGDLAIKQESGYSNATWTTAAPSVAMATAILTNNPAICAVFTGTNSTTTFTAPTSFTERFENGYNTPANGMQISTVDSGVTASTITWGGNAPSAHCAMVLELAASAINTKRLSALGVG